MILDYSNLLAKFYKGERDKEQGHKVGSKGLRTESVGMCVTYPALLSLNLPEEDGRGRLEKIGHPIRLERKRKDATARSFQTTT